MNRPLLVVEQLDGATLPVWWWLAWRNRGGYFISSTRFFRAGPIRLAVMRWTGLRPLRYEDFPGSYFEVQRRTVDLAGQDGLDPRGGGPAGAAAAFLRRFLDHPLMEVALTKALMDEYLLGRVKALVFLERLLKEDRRVVFFPKDNLDFRRWAAVPSSRSWGGCTSPVSTRIANRFRSWIGQAAFLGYLIFTVGRMIAQRGVTWAPASPRSWPVGFDLFDQGIPWDKPHHTSFLYDDQLLSPQKILHIVRDRLLDERTRLYLQERGIPFLEAGRAPIPVPFLIRRILVSFLGGTGWLALTRPLGEDSTPFLRAVASVILNLLRMEILESVHRVDLFVGRDEYNLGHIVRTAVYERRGGWTLSFCHGDDTHRTVSNGIIGCHLFCVPGPFHRELLIKSTTHCRSVPVIGAGIYGLDVTYQHLKTGWIPQRYRQLKERYRIVGVFGSSFQEDFFLTREMTLRFFRTALDLLKSHPEIVLVIRPKRKEFSDSEFRSLLKEAGPRAILEEEIWLYDLIPALDLMICIAVSSVGLEGLMAAKPVIYFDESGLDPHPYAEHDPRLVARTAQELRDRVEEILLGRNPLDPALLDRIRAFHGFRFDGKVAERLRGLIYQTLGQGPTPPTRFLLAEEAVGSLPQRV